MIKKTTPRGSLLTADGVVGQFYVHPDGSWGEVVHRLAPLLYHVREIFDIPPDGGDHDPRRFRGLNELEVCRFFATRDDAERARGDREVLATGRLMVAINGGGGQ